MAKGTKIEWADDTVNAEMGCEGCELWDPKNEVRICYAGLQTERMLSKGPLKGWPGTFDEPRIFPGRIAAARPCSPGLRPESCLTKSGTFASRHCLTVSASHVRFIIRLAPELGIMAASP